MVGMRIACFAGWTFSRSEVGDIGSFHMVTFILISGWNMDMDMVSGYYILEENESTNL